MRTSISLCLLCLSAWASSGESPVAGGAAPEDALLGTLPVVEAAALHAQTLEEAPANVTVITREEIRKYGYRTLAEALSAAPGFFSSYDGIYHYVGVRGFSVPGDYNTRFLVMLNGHPLTENVYQSNGFFGQDLGLDMDLVARIEIIRGPTSALYGSNGMLANINIVTRSPVDMPKLLVSAEAGSYGEKKGIVSASVNLGGGANLLVSASVFNTTGAPVEMPEGGLAYGVNGERGYHTFANLVWRRWSFEAYLNSREKQPPEPWAAGALPFERGDRVLDSRNFMLGAYSRQAGRGLFRLQFYYDNYRYDDRFYFPTDGAGQQEDHRSRSRGDAMGTQATYQVPLGGVGDLTLGGQFEGDLRNTQQDFMHVTGRAFLPPVDRPDLRGAFFAQQEWRVSPAITAYGGARLDCTRAFGCELSPRLAAVYRPRGKTAYKLVYGRPFRNPSAFENYYADYAGAFMASGVLRPETAQTVEASAERKLAPGFTAGVSAYNYRIDRMIEAVLQPGGGWQYGNAGYGRTRGVELELNKAGGRLEAGGSYAYQSSRTDRDAASARPSSVPAHLVKARAAAPLAGSGRLWASAAFEYVSSRHDYEGCTLRPAALLDLTLSTRRLSRNFDLAAGVRNLLGWRYSEPVSLRVASLPQNGRSVFIKLTYHARE
jgi:outer membrane receptor for ferrienterochelin and colicins